MSASVRLLDRDDCQRSEHEAPEIDAGSRLLHSVAEAAALLSLGATTLRALVRSGELGSVRVGDRRLIPHAALVGYVEALVAKEARA